MLKNIKEAFVKVIAEGEGTDRQKTIVYFAILIPVLIIIAFTYLIKSSILVDL